MKKTVLFQILLLFTSLGISEAGSATSILHDRAEQMEVKRGEEDLNDPKKMEYNPVITPNVGSLPWKWDGDVKSST